MRSRVLHSNDAWKVNIEAGSRAILIGPFVCEAIMDTANGGSGREPPKDRELTRRNWRITRPACRLRG